MLNGHAAENADEERKARQGFTGLPPCLVPTVHTRRKLSGRELFALAKTVTEVSSVLT